MPLGGEQGAVQRPFIRYAEEAGWQYLPPEQAQNLRRGLTSPLLDCVLIEQLQRLNPGIIDNSRAEQVRDEICRVRANIEGNLDAWGWLKGLKTVFVAPKSVKEMSDCWTRIILRTTSSTSRTN